MPVSTQRGHVLVGEVGAVVHRDQPELAGEPDAGAGAELVGVQPAAQALGRTGLQDRPGLVRVERAALAEHVDPPGVRRAGLQHRAGHQVDVRRGVVGVLRRDHVRAEEGGLVGDLPGDRERAGLVGDGEPVAALDLDGRGALPAHLVDEPGEVRGQLLVGGGAGGGDGGADAAGGVRRAGHPGRELLGAVAGEHQVAVRVDEAGDDRRARRRRTPCRRPVPAGPDRPTPRVRPRPPARRRAARPSSGSWVDSSPMPVRARVLTTGFSPPRGRARHRPRAGRP